MSDHDSSWLDWFINLHANKFLCRVPEEFAQDKFNLTGLDSVVEYFHDTLDAILDTEFNLLDPHLEMAERVYGLIHARYILSRRGIGDMCVKYQRGDFGCCPRIYCERQPVLPLGLTDHIGESRVKVYCPRCQDIYQPDARCSLLDGAMFGCSFPHMFFMQLPHLLPEPPFEKYTPRIYGFKLHKLALLPPTEDAPEKGASKQKVHKKDQRKPTDEGTSSSPNKSVMAKRYN